jgi:outer membrane protein assembly factor BamC
MRKINCLTIIFISFLAIGCSKTAEPVKKIGMGSRIVNYQADEKVNSLVIPPNLTEPSSQGAFIEIIDASNDDTVITKEAQNVRVMRDKYRRWLMIDKPANEVWALAKDFFRSYNFKIEKENQKIGIFETEYLEIETKVPDKSLGAIRTALSKALKTQYGLPIADKYRVRIEPTEDANISEIYLTLSSIGEVMSGSQRVWQPREKDIELETEMLLKLMVYLGNDSADAITKMQSSISAEKTIASVVTAESGFATLVFPYDKKQSWRFLGWALDELSIDIDDRDSVEGSYFIKVTPSKGLFSKLLSAAGSTKTYQLIVKEFDDSQTYVIFNDLSEENDSDTKNYSNELFNNIASKF